MSTPFNDLKQRIAETTAATSIGQFHELRDEIENGCYPPDQRGELDELLAEAFVKAKQAEESQPKS